MPPDAQCGVGSTMSINHTPRSQRVWNAAGRRAPLREEMSRGSAS
jgi:hypothetical protein